MPERDPSVDEANLSRRAVLLAGAALVVAGCTGGRTSMGGMDGIPMRPTTSGGTGNAGGGTTPPTMPIQQPPQTVQGNGYTIVPRKAWTSQPVKSNILAMGTVTRLTVHHTGEHGSWDNLPDTEIVQRIESYHRNDKGWAAIGYHFLVGKDGRIYEGRPAQYQGAHTSTQNENNLGISVIGDFMQKLPSNHQLIALKAFLDDKRREYGVGRSRVYGHRDLHSSLCPGDALYAWVKNYKSSQA